MGSGVGWIKTHARRFLIMDKEKKEKIALFRFGVISRLLWVKEDERQKEALLREITSVSWEIPFSGRTGLGGSATKASASRLPCLRSESLPALPTAGAQ